MITTMPLNFRPKYWFGERVQFDCRGRKGFGVIEAINFLEDDSINYLVYVGPEEEDDYQPSVFQNEIIPTETQKTKSHPTTIRPRYRFGQYVSFFFTQLKLVQDCPVEYESRTDLAYGHIYGIEIDKDFNYFYQIHVRNTNIHAPGVPENKIQSLIRGIDGK